MTTKPSSPAIADGLIAWTSEQMLKPIEPLLYYRAEADGTIEWGEDCVCHEDVYTNEAWAAENGTRGAKAYSEVVVSELQRQILDLEAKLAAAEARINMYSLAMNTAGVDALYARVNAAEARTVPAQTGMLTDEQIQEIYEQITSYVAKDEDLPGIFAFARAILAASAAPAVGQAVDLVAVLREYLVREMPAGTVIGDPAWWAPRIANAISRAAPAAQEDARDAARYRFVRTHPLLGPAMIKLMVGRLPLDESIDARIAGHV